MKHGVVWCDCKLRLWM